MENMCYCVIVCVCQLFVGKEECLYFLSVNERHHQTSLFTKTHTDKRYIKILKIFKNI